MNKRLIAILGVAVLGFGLAAGCAEEQGPMEEAGAAVDQAVEETHEAVQDAGEAVGEAVEEAGQAVENATSTN